MAKRSAAEWRQKKQQREAEQVVELALPSGFTVDARRPPIADWVKRKQIPSNLMAIAIDAHGTAQTSTAALMKGLKEKDIEDLLRFVAHTVQATVISPRVLSTVEGVLEENAELTDEQAREQSKVLLGVRIRERGTGEDETKRLPVVRELKEDEISADEISDEDSNFIFNWAMTGDGKSVEMGGGEVETEDLNNFRPNDTIPTSGGDSTSLRGAAEPIAGG